MTLRDLTKKTQKGEVVYHRLSTTPAEENALYCLVEGEDAKYYYVRIKNICKTNSRFFICGNKDEVIRAYNLVKKSKTLRSRNIAYFIDRDFDFDKTYPKEIFVTDVYSIENYYTPTETLEAVLQAELSLDITDKNFTEILEIYRKRFDEFHEHMLLLNSWIACQRDKSSSENKSKLNLQNTKIDSFVKITSDLVECNYTLEDLESSFTGSFKINKNDLEKKKMLLLKKMPQKSFRGKYEIDFLRKMLVLFKEKYPRLKLPLSKVNLISELSQYAVTSKELLHYLRRFST